MTDTNEVEREGISQEEIEREEFLEIRKDWASKIDPETAEMLWKYGSVLDPYGIYPPL